jgi:D-sedoheptulose 7-phosphate isomerase
MTSQSATAFSPERYLSAHAALHSKLNIVEFEAGIEVIRSQFVVGRKIITCGNGGSAATASHYITDWNKMVNLATEKPFRGVSLCDNIGLLTAYGNDLSFDDIFVGQLKAIFSPGDLLIAISGSGNSTNVLKAVEYANANDGHTLAIVGYDGGKLKKIAKQSVWVPSFDMQLCEDVHMMFGHMVMKALCCSPIND